MCSTNSRGSTPIALIESKNNRKSDKYCVKIKLCRDPTSEKSDLYEFKIALFENGDTEEFLFFVRKFQMNLKASETFAASANIHYLCTLLLLEKLITRKFQERLEEEYPWELQGYPIWR